LHPAPTSSRAIESGPSRHGRWGGDVRRGHQ
jgi:hypothetical protein